LLGILEELASGATDRAAQRNLYMSARTYSRRVAEMLDALDATTRFQAGVEAVRQGWITLPSHRDLRRTDAQGIGTIFGGATAGSVLSRVGEGKAVAIGLMLCAVSSLLMISSVDAVVLAGALFLGISVSLLVSGATTALQRRTPSSLRGRAAAAFELAVTVPQTTSIAVGASLIAIFSYQWLLLVIASVLVSSAIYLLSHREQRDASESATSASVVGPPAVRGTRRPPSETS